ncbi:MAG: chemoreceptor glutamine deamidase CheD [Rhodocyclaceae bacterium]|nr:chemoreceptor glutamine deamidase CheD [Rhodocyclaceae bacterium]MDZ4215207.1 chemoreceptor glutamine deamidase CheD [Rhodocyclaceae bacterium]
MSSYELGFVEHLAGNRYFDRKFESEAVKVLPGEYFVTSTNMLMVTVLGSCVSACIRDREKGIGGMNHFMLADSADSGAVSSSARYGTYAMEILINHLLKLGARKDRMEAKVFGGGRVMATLTSSQVGDRNAKFVHEFLKTEGISISAEDLLDVYPRKVYFFPATGRVLVKKLIRMHNDTLIRREKEYAARLTEAPVSGDVELF